MFLHTIAISEEKNTVQQKVLKSLKKKSDELMPTRILQTCIVEPNGEEKKTRSDILPLLLFYW